MTWITGIVPVLCTLLLMNAFESGLLSIKIATASSIADPSDQHMPYWAIFNSTVAYIETTSIKFERAVHFEDPSDST